MTSNRKLRTATAAVAAGGALLLSACGGGSSSAVDMPATPAAATQAPASAGASTSAYTTFAQSLRSSESAAPLQLNLIAQPPTSESDAPLPIV